MNDKIRVYKYEAFEGSIDRIFNRINQFRAMICYYPDLREWLYNILEGYIEPNVYNVYDLYVEICKTANIEPISFDKFDKAYQYKYFTIGMNFDEATLTLANIVFGWY